MLEVIASWERIRDTDRPWGFHADLWEFGANLLTIGIVSLFINSGNSKLSSYR